MEPKELHAWQQESNRIAHRGAFYGMLIAITTFSGGILLSSSC